MSSDDGSFSVNFGNGVSYDLDDIRNRPQSFMPDGGHAWVISSVYALADPETALDNMELTAESFIGVSQIHCLLCHEVYATANRYHKCPQNLTKRSPR